MPYLSALVLAVTMLSDAVAGPTRSELVAMPVGSPWALAVLLGVILLVAVLVSRRQS